MKGGAIRRAHQGPVSKRKTSVTDKVWCANNYIQLAPVGRGSGREEGSMIRRFRRWLDRRRERGHYREISEMQMWLMFRNRDNNWRRDFGRT